tara:strand:- start:261 stop:1187 length:927 start_codon:yes stop_codon:yes gene_type:complete
MDSSSKVFVAGHKGLVGSAIIRNLNQKGYNNIITANKSDCDLTNTSSVNDLFTSTKPDYVFLAAAKVGGIVANRDHPAEFIYDNLMIQSNVIDASYRYGIRKLVFLGSSCIYPKMAKQPITEDQLLTSPLEPSNDAYAIAKIAGLKMCRAYRDQYGFNAISLMPTNLYGPNDNFSYDSGHVLPAMIRKFHEASTFCHEKVTLWGDGSPKREFLHVDDLAEACYVCMQDYDDGDHINIGTGEDVSIKELAEIISKIINFRENIEWDTSKPNGTPRKLLNVDKIKALGWEPKINLNDGITSTYKWYKKSI